MNSYRIVDFSALTELEKAKNLPLPLQQLIQHLRTMSQMGDRLNIFRLEPSCAVEANQAMTHAQPRVPPSTMQR